MHALPHKTLKRFLTLSLVMTVMMIQGAVFAEAKKPLPPAKMTNQHLQTLIRRIDKHATGEAGIWRLTIADRQVTVITDARANRMRIISPVTEINGIRPKVLYRLMQANFDSALDARYSIAHGVIWSAYIHPLAELSDEQFLQGVGQVVNLVTTYGTSYSSGLLVFGGGDSQAIQRRELIDELLQKGLAI
jgi:hypothetical protein